MKHCRWREPFTLALWRCVWPDASKEIPFAEVLVADGLTSAAWIRCLVDWVVKKLGVWLMSMSVSTPQKNQKT
jgi:hypothetical protein